MLSKMHGTTTKKVLKRIIGKKDNGILFAYTESKLSETVISISFGT
jgi:hypothetical protein